MHALKQLVAAATSPLMAAILLSLIGLALCKLRYKKTGTGVIVTALAMAYLSATVIVGNMMLGPLERQYSALDEITEMPRADFVVVLGSSYAPRDGIPTTGALDEDGLARIAEGVRLLHLNSKAQLVLSGGAQKDSQSPARGYFKFARELGVAENSMTILPEGLDTAGEAQAIARLLGNRPFVLVTSAFHMPRAMLLMARMDAHPIPAPTAQRVDQAASGTIWWSLLPSSIGLRKTERALHEYIGLNAINLGLD